MTHFYKIRTGLFYQGKEVAHRFCGRCVKDESEVKNSEWHYTWTDVHELCDSNLIYAYIESRRKGRVLCVNGDVIFQEWDDADMELTLKVEYQKFVPSLHEVIHFHDGEKAIQWMLDRGLHAIDQQLKV